MSDQWKTRGTLLVRAKDPSDAEAWSEFVKFYERFIFHLLHRMNVNADDFDDLVQDILVKLWKNLKCYEAGEATFRTWLAKVVRNMVYDYFNKEKRRFERLGQVHEISIRLHDSSPGELEAMIEKEWITHLSRLAMSRLNKVFSGGALKVFTMTLEGDSSETIATKLNLKTTSVYTLRNRVKSRYLKEVHALMQELEGS